MIYLYLSAVGAAERRQSVVFKVGLPASLPACLSYIYTLSACVYVWVCEKPVYKQAPWFVAAKIVLLASTRPSLLRATNNSLSHSASHLIIFSHTWISFIVASCEVQFLRRAAHRPLELSLSSLAVSWFAHGAHQTCNSLFDFSLSALFARFLPLPFFGACVLQPPGRRPITSSF